MRRQITYNPQRDYYDILGVDASADRQALREAYRRAVRAVHPDLNPDRQDWATEQLKRVNEAYDVLSDNVRRRQYDQARWPHVPVGGRRSGHAQDHHASYTPPAYDPNRPWWEQARPAARHARTTSTPPRYRSHRRRTPPREPAWLGFSTWLKARGWQRLAAIWLALVGLWRSPYATLLAVLALILVADIALIVYVAATPYGWDDVQGWVDDLMHDQPAAPTMVPPLPTTIALADQLNLTCTNPDLRITSPTMGDPVPDAFDVYGTLRHDRLWAYRIALGFVGETASSGAVPTDWEVVRPSPTNQSIPERAVDDGVLTEAPVSLADRPAGFYALRLEVELRNGEILHPCDIVVRR